MAYKDCPDCGCRMYNGLCTNCDEETYILQQDIENEKHTNFSQDFKKKIDEQYNKINNK